MHRSNWTPVVIPTDRDLSVSGADNGRSRFERERGNNVPFSAGVALAAALPAFLGIGVYVASFVLLRAVNRHSSLGKLQTSGGKTL